MVFFYYACAFIAKVTFVNLFVIKYKIAIENWTRDGISFVDEKLVLVGKVTRLRPRLFRFWKLYSILFPTFLTMTIHIY